MQDLAIGCLSYSLIEVQSLKVPILTVLDILIKYIGVKSFNYIAVGLIYQNIKGTGIVVGSTNYIINEPNA